MIISQEQNIGKGTDRFALVIQDVAGNQLRLLDWRKVNNGMEEKFEPYQLNHFTIDSSGVVLLTEEDREALIKFLS